METTTTVNGSGEPATTRTTSDDDAIVPPPKQRTKPRKLSITDKLVELRDTHRAALVRLKEREAKLTLELERVRAQRADQEDSLRRVNATLPEAQRVEVADAHALADEAPRYPVAERG